MNNPLEEPKKNLNAQELLFGISGLNAILHLTLELNLEK